MPGFKGADRSSTAANGYGAPHARSRAAAFSVLDEWSQCCRCGRALWKYDVDKYGRSAVHLDHNRARDGYIGWAHAICNQRAGAAEGGRRVHAQRRARRTRRTAALPLTEPVDLPDELIQRPDLPVW